MNFYHPHIAIKIRIRSNLFVSFFPYLRPFVPDVSFFLHDTKLQIVITRCLGLDNHSSLHVRYGNHFLSREASSFLFGSGSTNRISPVSESAQKKRTSIFSHCAGALYYLLLLDWLE